MEQEQHVTPQIASSANPQILLSWRAPLRAYIKRSPRVLRFYLAVAILISLIIYFLGDLILLVPIWTLLFLFYVLTITPPPEVENKITQFGVETTGTTLRWETLDHFYFTNRLGYDVLTLVTHTPFFYHAYLIITSDEVKEKIIALLSKHIIYKEHPRKGFVERASDWLSKLVLEEVIEKDNVRSELSPSP